MSNIQPVSFTPNPAPFSTAAVDRAFKVGVKDTSATDRVHKTESRENARPVAASRPQVVYTSAATKVSASDAKQHRLINTRA